MTNENQRTELRGTAGVDSSVEFKPVNAELAYLFKLRDYSRKGLGILVNENSKVLQSIKAGDELDMKLYQGNDSPAPVPVRARIQHISRPAGGPQTNHLIVGLLILK